MGNAEEEEDVLEIEVYLYGSPLTHLLHHHSFFPVYSRAIEDISISASCT